MVVGCFGFNGPLRQGGGRVVRWCWVNFQCRGVLQFGYSRAMAYCARSRCVGWLVVFGLNDPLRQYFSLYRVVSQREGEREEKG